jgi:adenylate cyclase
LGVVFCASLDLLVMPGRTGAWLRRLPFAALSIIKGLWYGFALIAALHLGLLLSDDPWTWHDPRYRITLALSLLIAQVMGFIFSIADHLGHGVMRNLITGRYHRPREEMRVFLFVDLVGSTAIAERIGPTGFLRLLDAFVMDLAEPVLEHHGSIYRYVGDEVIVTWPLDKGIAAASCLRCVLAMRASLARKAEIYRARFGVAPEFRAALHAGPVVTGEIGTAKREIVFLGDTVNTTARIEEACRDLGHGILASEALMERLQLPAGIAARPLGPITLRGKAQPMALYALAAA